MALASATAKSSQDQKSKCQAKTHGILQRQTFSCPFFRYRRNVAPLDEQVTNKSAFGTVI
jgi:hypothetical protein